MQLNKLFFFFFSLLNIKCFVLQNKWRNIDSKKKKKLTIKKIQDAFVLRVSPCISPISSFMISFTIRCCWTLLFPWNSGDSTSIENMAPQPPLGIKTITWLIMIWVNLLLYLKYLLLGFYSLLQRKINKRGWAEGWRKKNKKTNKAPLFSLSFLSFVNKQHWSNTPCKETKSFWLICFSKPIFSLNGRIKLMGPNKIGRRARRLFISG